METWCMHRISELSGLRHLLIVCLLPPQTSVWRVRQSLSGSPTN